MKLQERLDKLAEELFGSREPYVMLTLDPNNNMPELVRHDGCGNMLDIAVWDGWSGKWIVIVEERNMI